MIFAPSFDIARRSIPDVAKRPTFDHSAQVRKEEVRYFLGLDLGQSHDPSAVTVVRRVRFLLAQDILGRAPVWKDEKPAIFQCGYLERVPLGTTYPSIVSHVSQLLQRPIWCGQIDMAIDQTGVGRPVADMFSAAGLSFAGVMITGGDNETREGDIHRVPKMTLISALQALLHEGRLHIQKELPEAAELVRELQDFRVKYTESGHLTFNAREGRHDDLVLALAIAVWRARKHITKTQSFYMNWIER
jgi:hypothetical protein